jgi:hypothetical protein
LLIKIFSQKNSLFICYNFFLDAFFEKTFPFTRLTVSLFSLKGPTKAVLPDEKAQGIRKPPATIRKIRRQKIHWPPAFFPE